jgi:hypothetical protein
MGRVCSVEGMRDMNNVSVGTPVGCIGVDGMITLIRILNRVCENVNWIHLAQDRTQLCSVVNNLMNLRLL